MAGPAFEILSIDIADVDVGRNIGAQLQMDQAKPIAVSLQAAERRAMAVAHERNEGGCAGDARQVWLRQRLRCRVPWPLRC